MHSSNIKNKQNKIAYIKDWKKFDIIDITLKAT